MISIILADMPIIEKVYIIAFILISVIVAISVHEWAHAYAAHKMGDDTAKNLGRMTINPFAHLDITGFLMLMLVGFGWAKPVPINERNFKDQRKGMLLVSCAGIIANLIMAMVAILIILTLKWTGCIYPISDTGNIFTAMDITNTYTVSTAAMWAFLFLYMFASINCSLFVFNLLPIAPLDGSHIFEILLIRKTGPRPWLWLRKNGRYVLIGFMLISVFMAQTVGFSPISFLSNGLMNGIYTIFNAIAKLGSSL